MIARAAKIRFNPMKSSLKPVVGLLAILHFWERLERAKHVIY